MSFKKSVNKVSIKSVQLQLKNECEALNSPNFWALFTVNLKCSKHLGSNLDEALGIPA